MDCCCLINQSIYWCFKAWNRRELRIVVRRKQQPCSIWVDNRHCWGRQHPRLINQFCCGERDRTQDERPHAIHDKRGLSVLNNGPFILCRSHSTHYGGEGRGWGGRELLLGGETDASAHHPIKWSDLITYKGVLLENPKRPTRLLCVKGTSCKVTLLWLLLSLIAVVVYTIITWWIMSHITLHYLSYHQLRS